MKTRFLCALTALMLIAAPALAEGEPTPAPAKTAKITPAPTAETAAPTIALVTPTPSPAPAGTTFEADGVRLILPEGLKPLEGELLEAYEAAPQADYPDTAETILAAVDAERGAALTLARAVSDKDCLDAAREAAEVLIGNPDAAAEEEFGANRAASFACAIGEQTYRLYYLSDGAHLLIVGASGLEQSEIDQALASLEF